LLGGCICCCRSGEEDVHDMTTEQNFFVHLRKDGNFMLDEVFFFFVYYQKEWNFMFAQIFFCLLRNGSNFPLYFLLNVHTQFLFFYFFGFVYCYRNIISKLKTVCSEEPNS
jgi:hypothetical protein